MPDSLRHFAINCDDTDRAKTFYVGRLHGDSKRGVRRDFSILVMGSIQPRRELVPGVRMSGMECSFGVEDIDATQAAIEQLGGKIIMPKVVIPTVGPLFFQDPEGNLAGRCSTRFSLDEAP